MCRTGGDNMAKKGKEAFAGLRAVSAKSDNRLSRIPALGVIATDIQREIGKRISGKAVRKNFQDLALRKTTLEKVLLDVTRSAEAIVAGAFKDGKKTTDDEIRLDKQHRESLIKRKREEKPGRAHRVKKDEYLVTGHLLHPKTGKPAPGMVVEVADRDIRKHDRLGVDTTDSKGRFEIVFTEKDFRESGEGLPEIVILAGVDRLTAEPVTKDVIKLKPGTREVLEIKLPDKMESAVNKIAERRDRVDKKRIMKTNQNLVVNKLALMAVGEISESIKGSLGQFVNVFEKRVKAGDTAKEKTKHKRKAKKKD